MTASARVLVVEDEEHIRHFIEINLKRQGFDVKLVESGEQAIDALKKGAFDAVVLDVRLPGIDGFEVCRHIRKHFEDIAILIVTARAQDMDKVMGLEIGADDYITKPFNPLELIARIHAVLRRTRHVKLKPTIYRVGELMLNSETHQVTARGNTVQLTPKEYNLLTLLMKNPDRVYNRGDLLDEVWGASFGGDPKTLDVHIRRLREKLEPDPSIPKYIETVFGIGYRLRRPNLP